LGELANRGLIAFRRIGDEEYLAPSGISSLPEREVSFELTGAGGRAWEKAAEPRWNEMTSGFAEQNSLADGGYRWDWTWFSQDRERLMAVLGWYPMIQREQIDLSSVEWTTHDDYPVNYWKHLPDIHVVRFCSVSAGESMAGWPRGHEPQWFTDWRVSSQSWYRKPWEMAGWPPPVL
jgi:hypothetical protein